MMPPMKAKHVAVKLREMRLGKAADLVESCVHETLTHMNFPREHWLMIRRRTRVIGAFPDGNSALMLVAARLRHITSSHWADRRYLDMDRLAEQDREQEAARLAETSPITENSQAA